MATKKIRPGDRIAQLLCVDGQPVGIDAILSMFRSDPVLAPTEYKISGYVGDIRKYHQGVVRVGKDGRKVVSYQLLNFHEFDATTGHRLTGDALLAAQAKADATKPIVESANAYTQISVVESVASTADPTSQPLYLPPGASDPVPAAEEVVTETADEVTSTEPVADAPEVTASEPAADAPEVTSTEPVADAEQTPAKPKRNRGKFNQPAAA